MSRYIDFYLIGELVDSHGNVHYEDLKNLPTADVVEVVRCKDCKDYDSHDHRCKFFNHGIVENDYCSRAIERREDAEAVNTKN